MMELAPEETVIALDVDGQMGSSGIRRMPDRPFSNQKVGPCDAAKLEVSINGGCWIEVVKPPGVTTCGTAAFDHNGRCYKVVPLTRQTPKSSAPVTPSH